MIYFIHDQTSRTIKIGCARNPRKRLSTLQISTPNKLVLLGAIGGTERTEKKVHELVYQNCPAKPDGPLRVQGEWFDECILPFVTELMKCPKAFLQADKKKPHHTRHPVNRDNSLHRGKFVLVFDSGEMFHESFILKAAEPERALTSLMKIADARRKFLAHTTRITQLRVAGCPTRKVNLQGVFVTQNCNPRDGLSVIFNSRADDVLETKGVKLYSDRWLHGLPSELYSDERRLWIFGRRAYLQPTDQLTALLDQFAQALNQNQCVIIAQTPLVVRGLIPRGIASLPKGKLRSKANQKAASKQNRKRSPDEAPRRKNGIVYFIQDEVTLAIKVGFCLKKPENRLAALKIGNSNPLRLLGHVRGSDLDEKNLHKRFSQCHIRGEWFTNAIIADIEDILRCSSLEEWLNVMPKKRLVCGEQNKREQQ